MPPATAHEHALGLTFVVDEPLQRAWHALRDGDRVWLADPLDDPAALARVQELGEVAGVLQLLDRHARACAELAARLGVDHHVVPRAVAGGGFEVVDVLRVPVWNEIALWWPAQRALVVAETVGTHPIWAAGPPRAGVHPMVRLAPPGGLGRFQPELLLVGHGPPVVGAAAAPALQGALTRTRRDLPRLALRLPAMWRSGRAA
jgi:hypothetical protein